MADATNAPVQGSEPGTPSPDPKRGAGFLATTSGKVVIAVIAVVVLLAIAGVILGMFAFGGVSSWLNSGSGATTSTTTSSSTTTTTASTVATAPAATVPVLEPAEKPLTATFTFRNVFAPTIKPPAPPATETTSSGGSTSGSTDSPDTLYLIDIVSTDEGPQGVFVWNGTTYTVGEGETVGSSPWKVLEVGTDSVVMLYGDTQVTLSLGQGISK